MVANFVVGVILCYLAVSVDAVNITVVEYFGKTSILTCDIGTYTYPRWAGPPNGLTYTYLGNSGFNSIGLGEKAARLMWAVNKRDLIINDTQLTDAGEYECQTLILTFTVELTVRVAPSPPEIQNNETLGAKTIVRGTEAQTVILTCISRGGHPAPYLDWYRVDNKLTSSRNEVKQPDNTTTVTATTSVFARRIDDRVLYSCRSSYDLPDSPLITSISLYLSLKPSSPVISGHFTVSEKTSTQLQCITTGCRPEGNISWSFDGGSSTTVRSTLDSSSETYTLVSNYTTGILQRADNGQNIECRVGHETLESLLVTRRILNIQFAAQTVELNGNRDFTADGVNTLTLTCIAYFANPVANITWSGVVVSSIIRDVETGDLHNGKKREQEIAIIPKRDMDGDAISCTAEHFLLTPSQWPAQTVNLSLTYNPIVTIREGDSIIFNEGDTNQRIHCSASSKPSSVFTWYHGIELVRNSITAVDTNEFDFNISTVSRTHYGVYKCEANNSILSAGQGSIAVKVKFPPRTVSLTGNQQIEASGQNILTLRCSTDSAYPTATVKWWNGSTVFTSGTNQSHSEGNYGGNLTVGQLKFRPTRYMDGDTISCRASNSRNPSSPVQDQVALNLTYEPITTVLDGKKKIVIEGQSNVALTCSAESKPPSRFKWYKDSSNTPIKSGTGIPSRNTLVYTITTVNRNHTGNYSCTAENGLGNPDNSDAKIQLIVHYPPDVTVTAVNATINDTYADIYCEASGVPSGYSFSTWRQTWPGGLAIRDQLSSTDTSLSSKRTLRLTSLTYQDTGVYTCSASNGINGVIMTGSVYLLVKSYPKVTLPVLAIGETLHKVPASLNKQFRFNMTVYSNAGAISALLYRLYNNTKVDVNASFEIKDNSMVKLEVYGHEVNTDGYSLSASHVIRNEEHFGHFYVGITNGIGTTSVQLEIIPKGPPCTPKNVTIAESSSRSITLSWIRCFYGGLEQTFAIQHSKDGLKWTNSSFVNGGLSTSKEILNTTIETLQPNTLYHIVLFAFNDLGRSDLTAVFNVTTKTEDNGHVSESNVGLIAGAAAGGVIAAVIIIVVVLFLLRRHKRPHGSPKKSLLKENGRNHGAGENDDLPEINLNPMYESAGPRPSTSNSNDVYAEVKKPKKVPKDNQDKTDLYAQVQKPSKKENQNVGTTSDLYSTPVKTQKDKQKKKKEKKQKPDKSKADKNKGGMVYENADSLKTDTKDVDNVYENPSCSTEDEKPTRTRNEDGLIYVEVELPQQKGKNDSKPVIHGLENSNDYADIQFGKVGEQAPESDEEENKKTE